MKEQDINSDSDNDSECDSFDVACLFKKVVRTGCYTCCGKYTPLPLFYFNIPSQEIIEANCKISGF